MEDAKQLWSWWQSLLAGFGPVFTRPGWTRPGARGAIGYNRNGIDASNIRRSSTCGDSTGVTARGFPNSCCAWRRLKKSLRPPLPPEKRKKSLPEIVETAG